MARPYIVDGNGGGRLGMDGFSPAPRKQLVYVPPPPVKVITTGPGTEPVIQYPTPMYIPPKTVLPTTVPILPAVMPKPPTVAPWIAPPPLGQGSTFTVPDTVVPSETLLTVADSGSGGGGMSGLSDLFSGIGQAFSDLTHPGTPDAVSTVPTSGGGSSSGTIVLIVVVAVAAYFMLRD